MSDVKKLEATVAEMSALADEWLDRVSALAGLALTELERPPSAPALLRVIRALKMIESMSDDLHDCIDVAAERVGLSHDDEAGHVLRRMLYDALRKPAVVAESTGVRP